MADLRFIKNRIYYSQNREDLILEAFFVGEKNGFYVDVGAYDPDYDSVTKLFYLKGWKGINIEPQKDRYMLFEKKRKKDINLNVGVAEKQGILKLRSYSNQGLSTFSDDIKKEYEIIKSKDKEIKTYKDNDVKVLPLKQIFEQNNVHKIQFMKVDVEGFEKEVIYSNDWTRYRPEVLCIEANHVIHKWESKLISEGYKKTFFDGLNNYYVDSRTNRADKFDYVNRIVLELGGGIRIEDYNLIESMQKEIEKLNEIIFFADKELKEKTKEKESLEKNIEELKGIRAASKHLKNQVKQRLKGSRG